MEERGCELVQFVALGCSKRSNWVLVDCIALSLPCCCSDGSTIIRFFNWTQQAG